MRSTTISARRSGRVAPLIAMLCALTSQQSLACEKHAADAWREFIGPIEVAFSRKLDHIAVFEDAVAPVLINEMRLDGAGRLMVQEVDGAEYEPAPEELAGRVGNSFRELGLFAARSDGQIVELLPAAPFPEFNEVPLAVTVIHGQMALLRDSRCDGESMVVGTKGGHCWWPLPAPGWYLDIFWLPHEACRD